MSSILEKKWRRVEEYVAWVRESFTTRLAVLFGSLARGDWTERSDVDMLVVADELGLDVGENYVRLKRYGVEPLGYSTQAFLEEIRRPNFLILDALRYGKMLYVDEEYLEEVDGALEWVRERFGVRYDGRGWWFKPLR